MLLLLKKIPLRSSLQNHLIFCITEENIYMTHKQTDPIPLPLLEAAWTWTCFSLGGFEMHPQPPGGTYSLSPVNMDLWLPWPELASPSWEQGEANMGLCSGMSEQGTTTQQSRALFPKELESNLLFRTNVKMAVNSFRVEIRGAQCQQKRDCGRESDSMVPQKKTPTNMRALNTGWAEKGTEPPSKKPPSIWFLLHSEKQGFAQCL